MLYWNGPERPGRVVPLDPKRRNGSERSVESLIDLMGASMHFDRNAEIFGEGEPAGYLYKLVDGAVRISKLMSDGRRQIGAFCLPGDIFGLEAEPIHRFSAEAVADCAVLVVKRSAFLAEASRDSGVSAELWAQALAELQRAQAHLLLLGRKNARERVATFLLEMASRLPRQGAVELPMSRQDIADYLGITIETVSRTLSQFEREGVISIPVSRRILLRDRGVLDEMNDCLAA